MVSVSLVTYTGDQGPANGRLTDTGGNKDSSRRCSADGHQSGIIGRRGSDESGHLSVVQTLASRAVEENGSIAENIVDEAVHRGFGKGAALVFSTGKGTGTLDFFCEKVVDVYASAGNPCSKDNSDMATY